MKFCKDCKHCSNISPYRPAPECMHEKSIYKICKVTGKVYFRKCYEMRGYGGICGDEPNLFEEKIVHFGLIRRLNNFICQTKE